MLKDSNRYAAYRAGRLFSSICGILLLANCSLYNTVTRRAVQSVTPYRITVVQGNFVSSEAAAQLKAGMTREQARSVLGTPLLADMFHANRWDYLFYFRRGETQVVRQRHLTLYFDQDQLTHWSGAEDLPTEYELIAGIEWTGRDAGARFGQTTGVAVSEDIEAGLAKVEYLIDFTSAEYTLACLPVARRHGIKLVIGTTGFSEQQRAGIEIASRALPIVLAPNMSMGVNLYLKLIETAARLFKDRYDIEIIEAHHRHKADAPSGTALKMGEIIARATGCDLSKMSVCGRTPITGARKPLEIGFSAIRGGDIVGDHTVLFAGEGERIELTHRSSSRASYALGALRAVHFLADKTSGLFDMQDVLGLR